MKLEECLAVPFVMGLESAVSEDGRWTRFASYPELGLTVSAATVLEAIESLERLRVRHIRQLVAAGERIPTRRRPLRNTNGWSEQLSADLLEALV